MWTCFFCKLPIEGFCVSCSYCLTWYHADEKKNVNVVPATTKKLISGVRKIGFAKNASPYSLKNNICKNYQEEKIQIWANLLQIYANLPKFAQIQENLIKFLF